MSAAEIIGLVGMAVHAVRMLLDNKGTRTAEQVIDAIERIYGAVDDAVDGKVTGEQASASIAALLQGLRTNDAAADAALKDKFKETP